MKTLKLNSVFYFSWGGITLTIEKPTAEISEEDIIKFNKFIEIGYLKIVGEGVEPTILDSQIVEIEKEILEDIEELPQYIKTSTTRIPVYSLEALEKMTKKELQKIAKDNGFAFDKKATVKDLVNLIAENQ